MISSTGSEEFTVRRETTYATGCRGEPVYTGDDGVSIKLGVRPEPIIGHLLGEGARIRVSVEVLDEGRGIENTVNPRHTSEDVFECVCTRRHTDRSAIGEHK